MKKYEQEKFTGERALFQGKDLELSFCTFADGESPLKESHNIRLDNCMFQWKYPLWYSHDIEVTDSTMFEMARAGIWYTDDIKLKNMTIDAPKAFRRCRRLYLENANFSDAAETLWNCSSVKLKDVTAKGDYFGMGCTDVEIENFTLFGNYCFDGARNVTVRNARMLSKDCFWNCENVTIYDSFISGEYFGWNSKNVTLINCTVESLQGMCYMDNAVMKDCRLLNTNLAFEYSTVDATVDSRIDSVKNPTSGRIAAEDIGEIIFDDPKVNRADTIIKTGREALENAV